MINNINTERLKSIVRLWHNEARDNPPSEYHQGLCNAYVSVLDIIFLLEDDVKQKDYLCTCQTIRCDECIIREK